MDTLATAPLPSGEGVNTLLPVSRKSWAVLINYTWAIVKAFWFITLFIGTISLISALLMCLFTVGYCGFLISSTKFPNLVSYFNSWVGKGKALVYKAVTLGQHKRGEEAVVAYDEVVRRFGDAPEAALREQVAQALVYKAVTLGQLKRGEEEVVVYDEVVRRFGDALEAALREQVGKALVYKGVTLAVSGRLPEAQAILETALTKYEGAVEPEIENFVRRARELLEQVKNAQEGGNEQTRG